MLVAREIGSPARSRLEVLGAGSETSRDTAEGDENRDESLGLPSTLSLPHSVTLSVLVSQSDLSMLAKSNSAICRGRLMLSAQWDD